MTPMARAVVAVVAVLAMASGDTTGALGCLMVALLARRPGDTGGDTHG